MSQSSYGMPSTPLPEIKGVEGWCGALSKELRSVDRERCVQRPWKVNAQSHQKIPIPELTWGPEDGRHVMIIGGIHGDELSSVSLVFRWIDFLERVRAESPLRKMRFMFLPLTNPDGFWARPRTRTNFSGVDLNRNFPTKGWESEALRYWKTRTKSDKRRFPGTAPSSEVETKFIEERLSSFQPELVISVHAPYGILDHDGPVVLPKNLHSPLPVKTLGAFPGSLGRYAGIDRNIPVITVELMTDKTMPEAKAIEELFVFIMNTRSKGVQSVVR